MAATDTLTRKLPFSLEAEQSVLGSILIDPESISEIATIITTEDFYLEKHREIYSAMQRLFLKSKDIDAIVLAEELTKEGVYTSDESKAYIRTLADIVPATNNVKEYARIVKDKSLLRALIAVCGDITESAYAAQDDVSFILDNAGGSIFALTQNQQQSDFTHIRDVIVDAYAHLKALSENSEDIKGVETGFSALDNVLVGMGKGNLILIGARPGMGKTSFALNIASNVARKTGKEVCIFSLEMSKQELVMRMLSSEAMVESNKLRSGTLSKEDWDKLARAAEYLAACNIYIDDTSGITVTGMKSKLRKKRNLGLVVVDYLQLMSSDKKIDNRVLEVGDISRNMKLMAKDLGVPVLCCAQLSRGPESRTSKKPMLSDLRDSGAIEQDADAVLFLYREMYYDDGTGKTPADENVAEVIVAKNRHGSTDSGIKMGWYGQFTKFTSIDHREDSAE